MPLATNKWYDLYDDWDLIEASIAQQYGIRLRLEIRTIKWAEVRTLISGLLPSTPLGKIVSIRSESDKDTLKNYTPEMHKIRNTWLNKVAQSRLKNEEQLNKDFEAMAKTLEMMFG